VSERESQRTKKLIVCARERARQSEEEHDESICVRHKEGEGGEIVCARVRKKETERESANEREGGEMCAKKDKHDRHGAHTLKNLRK
jgi:hypothetical protein